MPKTARETGPDKVYIDQFNSPEMIQKLLVHVLSLKGYEKSEGVRNRLQPMVWLNDYFENTGRIRERQSTAGLQDTCLRPAYQALLGHKKPRFEQLMTLYNSGEVIHIPVYSKKHLFCLSFFQLHHQLYMGITNGGSWPDGTSRKLPDIDTKSPQVIYKLDDRLQLEELEAFYFAGTGRQKANAIVGHLEYFLDKHRVNASLKVPTIISQGIGNCGWYNFTGAARLPLYVKEHRAAHPRESDLMVNGLGNFERKVNQLYRDWLREVQVYMLVRSHNRCVEEKWIGSRDLQDFLDKCRDKIQGDLRQYVDRTRYGYRQGVYDDFLRNYHPGDREVISRIPTSQTIQRQQAPGGFFPPPAHVPPAHVPPAHVPPAHVPPAPKKCCIIL